MGVTYKLTSFGKAHQALPGVPWRDLTAEEYEAAVARHPGMEDHGYFARVEDAEEETPAKPRRTSHADAVKPAEENTDG